MTSVSSKRFFAKFSNLVVVLLAIVIAINVATPASASMNIDVSGSKVKIMIGAMDESAPLGYSRTRNTFLTELAENMPEERYSAVVSMDNYYTEAEILETIQNYNLQLERIYMWVPGETGKMSLFIENNDINAAKERFFKKMKSHLGEADGIQEKLIELAGGEVKVYAITVSGTAQELKEVAELESKFAAVDVKYNPDAEKYARDRNMTYSYVEMPAKPDGAL